MINETCYVRATFTDYPAQCVDGQGVLLTLIYSDGWRRQIFYSPHSDNQKVHTFERISATSDVEYSSWYEFARCFEPEVHDLPLADGWQIFGTSKNWCCKDQFNQVTVFFRLKSTGTNITEGVVMATLPEGYRPRSSVTMPGLITFDNYTRLPCHIDAGPSGALQLYVDGTTPSGRSVIELTCAGFRYPAK